MNKDADKVEAGKAVSHAYAPQKQNSGSGSGDDGSGNPGMPERLVKPVVTGLGVLLCLFTLFEVNYNTLQPQSALAVFVGCGACSVLLDISSSQAVCRCHFIAVR